MACLDDPRLGAQLKAACLAAMPARAAPPLRVCADPDNLPYSHADGRGFETRIAQVVAEELQRPLAISSGGS